MAKSKRRKGKHIPQRTCVGCRQVLSKRELVRIVRTPDGIVVEEDQRLAGRGAYLHADPACWDKAMNVKLGKALRIELTAEDLERLQSSMKMLPKPEMVMKTKVEELIS